GRWAATLGVSWKRSSGVKRICHLAASAATPTERAWRMRKAATAAATVPRRRTLRNRRGGITRHALRRNMGWRRPPSLEPDLGAAGGAGAAGVAGFGASAFFGVLVGRSYLMP